MDLPKISVVIPVYNVEAYIAECLQSVMRQTYAGPMECIVVDDCGTDKSVEIVKQLMAEYEGPIAFKLLHHEHNRGISAARNTGLKAATGDYVFFADSDDYIHCQTIELLLQACEQEQSELSVADFLCTYSSDEDTQCSFEKKELQRVSIDTAMFEMLAHVAIKWCVVWNKLYKRSLIDGLFFNEEAYSIEDQDFNIRVYQRLENVVCVPHCLYFYYQNPSSIVRNPSTTAKRFYMNTKYRFKMLEHIQLGENDEKYRAWIMDYGYRQVLDRIGIVKGTEYDESFRQMVKTVWRKTRKDYLTNDEITSKEKCHFVFYWFFPQLSNCYLRIRK